VCVLPHLNPLLKGEEVKIPLLLLGEGVRE